MIGRDKELGALAAVLARVRSGGAAVAVVEGEGGIGKTSLLDAALADAGRRAPVPVTLRPQPDELAWSRPFGALADALGVGPRAPDRARRVLDSMLRAGGTPVEHAVGLGSPAGDQFAVVERFVELLEALAAEQPVVLVLDDLHLVEPTTAAAVPTIVRRLRHQPLAVIAALRPSGASPEVARAVGALDRLGADRIALGPLADAEVRDLAARELGHAPGPGLLDQLAGARGNPLFALELLGGLRDEGALEVDADQVEVRGSLLPPAFRAAVDRRLRGLPADTLAAVWAASILGAAFPLDDLALALGTAPLEALRRLQPALEEGVLVERGEQLGFAHGLVADAVYQGLPSAGRRSLHRELGRALLAADRPAVQAARHLALGAEPGDDVALGALRAAAADASTRAPALAAELLEHALELVDPGDDEQRRAVATDLLLVLAWSGRPADAEAKARALLDDLGPDAPGLAHLALALSLQMQGDVAGCVAAVEAAIASPDTIHATGTRARLLVEASLGRLLGGDLAAAVDHASRGRSLGEEAHDPLAVSGALVTLGWVEQLRGRYDSGLGLTGEAVAVAAGTDGAGSQRHPWLFHGVGLLAADRWDEAEQQLEAGRRQASAAGTVWSLPLYHMAVALRHYLAGDWDDAVAEVDAALDQADELGARAGLIWPLSIRALIAVHRDDLVAAGAALERVDEELARVGPQFGDAWASCARAMVLEAEGRVADGLAALVPVWQRDRSLGIVSELQIVGPTVTRLALASGDRELAAEVARDATAAAATAGAPGFVGNAARCRGLVEDDPDLLADAAATLATTPRVDRFSASCEAAVSLARHGRIDEARPHVEAAFAGFTALEATRLAAMADAELRAVGVRRGRAGPRRRPATGWEALTDTERQVVRLVREGLTNAGIAERLFISRRTVETHVSHVFAKLGISSRRALVDGPEAGG